MPSSRTLTGEDQAQFTVPVGSERVVNIRRLSTENKSKEQIEPLSINTHYPSRIGMIELQSQRKVSVKKKHRSEHHTKTHSPRKSERHNQDIVIPRTRKAWSASHPDNDQQPKKVISYLEMDIPRTYRSVHSIPVYQSRELGSNVENHKESKPHRKSHRSSERQTWLSSEAKSVESQKWRHSNIFAPEEPRVRSTRIRVRRPDSEAVQPAQPSPMWSPFIPFPVNYYPSFPHPYCQRCGDSVAPPARSVSYDAVGYPHPRQGSFAANEAPYPPYPSYSSENVFHPTRSTSHHHNHRHYQQNLRMNRSRTMPPFQPYAPSYDQDRPVRVPSLGTVLSTSAENMLETENNQTDRVVMEIEYADDDDSEYKMSPETLRLIVRLAKQARKIQDLEEMAKHLKLELDKQLGERWQVVVGDDCFGSYLAHLPGALANFRINRDVFLVWQT